MMCLTPKPSHSFFVYRLQKKERLLFFFVFVFTEKSFLRKRGVGGRKKECFLAALSMVIKKDFTTSTKKHANEMLFHEKTSRTAVKQDISSDLNSLDYAIWSIFENKRNVTSHQNIGSL